MELPSNQELKSTDTFYCSESDGKNQTKNTLNLEMKEPLDFEGREPGAVRHGNFINYYAFHPASVRVENFPNDIWNLDHHQERIAILDVGCNTGELTTELHSLLSNSLKCNEGNKLVDVKTLGIDLDPTLIQRAQEGNICSSNIEFMCTDMMKEESEAVIQDFLSRTGVTKFKVVFLMSVTMWVHIMNGDQALRSLLIRCAQLTDKWLVLEPQYWSNYRKAQRRLVKSGVPGFPLYPSLQIKGPELLTFMHTVLTEECGMKKVCETKPSKWRRTTSFYEKI